MKKGRFHVVLNNGFIYSGHRLFDVAVKKAFSKKLRGYCHIVDSLDGEILYKSK